MNGLWSIYAQNVLYEPLIAYDQNMKLVNVLAKSFEPDNTASKWTVVLKDGLTFSDGRPVTADDVVYSMKRIQDPKLFALNIAVFNNVASVKAVDNKTVVFTLKGPDAGFAKLMGDSGPMGIVPTDFDPKHPISTGPWVLQSMTPGTEAVFVRNENYWGEKAHADKLVLKVLTDNDARVNALISGQVDAIINPGAQVASLKSNPSINVLPLPSANGGTIYMNTATGPTADPRVRQALRLSVDRKQILQVIAGGYGTITNDLYGTWDEDFASDLKRSQDIDAAKKLVAEAGAEGAKMQLTVPPLAKDFAQIIAEGAHKVGLDLSVNVVDEAKIYEQAGQWQMTAEQMVPRGIINFSLTVDGPGAAYNYSHWNDPEYTAEYKKAISSTTLEERRVHLRRIQEILFERGYLIYPVAMDTVLAVSKNTRGWPTADKNGFAVWDGMSSVWRTDQ